jgi:hypothetical protein
MQPIQYVLTATTVPDTNQKKLHCTNISPYLGIGSITDFCMNQAPCDLVVNQNM